jgi:hypothetical protein
VESGTNRVSSHSFGYPLPQVGATIRSEGATVVVTAMAGLKALRRSLRRDASGARATPPPAAAAELCAALGDDAVLWRPDDVLVYEYDYGLDRQAPQIVVFPQSAGQVAAVARIAAQFGLPLVPRGAGTGIAGGAVPAQGGIVVALSRLKRLLRID